MMSQGNKLTRRGFLMAMTGSAIAAAAGCRPANMVVPTLYAPGSAPHAVNTPVPTVAESAAVVKDPNWGDITFDKIFYTPAENLYITQYDYSNTPQIDAASWSMKVDGLVDKPVTLDYAALKAFPVYEDVRTLECISNPPGGSLIGNLQLKGFLFSDLLKQVGVQDKASYVKFSAADGYETAVEMKWLKQDTVMMAYEMNGAPLTAKHGFPVRIMIPGLYGQKMARWITHIEFINYDFHGYWESNGWSNVASIQTMSAIKGPSDSGQVKAGATLAIQGVAFAGVRKIVKVEVQIDNGQWMPAQLTYGPSSLSWTQWYLTWKVPSPGSYQISVRATDDTGFTQSPNGAGTFGDAFPNGTNAIGQISINAA